MGKQLSITLGFTVGFAAACLLNPKAYSRMTSQAIAWPISQGIANLLIQIAPAPSAQEFAMAGDSCLGSLSQSQEALSASRPVNISLLKHVPVPPQRLNWYSLTQGAAIVKAPQLPALKPAITRWQATAPEASQPQTSCLANLANHRSNLSSGLVQDSLANLHQQSHFILSLASLNQKNDWLLEGQPEPIQPIHQIWRDQDPMSLKLGKFEVMNPQTRALKLGTELASQTQ